MLIPIQNLHKKYNLNIKGILHVGANYGQEAQAYREITTAPIVFIEAIKPVYRELKRRMTHFRDITCLLACVSDEDGQIVDFHIASNEGQSSSMLEFGTHSAEHPTVVFTNHTKLQTTTVKTLLNTHGLDSVNYNFINLDIQGAELMALKGMDLSGVDYAYIEVNEKELYTGCPLIGNIDDHMKRFDLHRVETHMTSHGWGDAFYIKNTRTVTGMVEVPEHFKPAHPFRYPKDNEIDFERWYYENFTEAKGRVYLPIMWTAYYCKNRYGKDPKALAGLQEFLHGLDKSVKYYTIVQYDDGILNDVSMLDLKVFSMSGKPMDVALPLLCQPHAPLRAEHRDVICNFVGRVTHPIRQELVRYSSTPNWFIHTKHMPLAQFCDVLNRSIFTLCPRGYGPTSFRIMEAMQYGSIPVYISDEHIIPWGIDFTRYGILVKPDQVCQLPHILSQVDISALQAGVESHYILYTYQSNKKLIDDHNTI